MRSATKKVAGGILLLWVTLSFAWEKESNEFQFPLAGVKRGRTVVTKGFTFSGSYNRSKNSVIFFYSLPKNTKDAVLNVYSIKGALVKSFTLKNDAKMFSWDVTNQTVAMGTYAVSLKCDAIEKNLRLILVK
jgi:hypothetical protein